MDRQAIQSRLDALRAEKASRQEMQDRLAGLRMEKARREQAEFEPIPGVISANEPTAGGVLRDVAGEVADMAALGWADEIASFGDAERLAELRERRENFREDNPYSWWAYGLPGLALGPQAVFKGLPHLLNAVPLVGKTVAASKAMPVITGAVEGGIAGAGAADEDKTQGGLVGAAIGGAIPPVAGLAGKYLGPPIQQAWEGLVGTGTPQVQRAVKRVIENSGMTDDQILAQARRFGPEAGLIDVTGPAGIAAAQQVSKASTPARSVMQKISNQRADDATRRIRESVLGAADIEAKPVDDFISELVDKQSKVSKQNYAVAYSRGEPLRSPEVQEVLSRPAVQKLVEQVRKKQAAQGNTNMGQVELLDRVKRAAYRKYERTQNKLTGKAADEGADWKYVYGKLADHLSQDDAYEIASAAHRVSSKIGEAADAGRKFMNKDFTKTRAQLRRMSPDERKAYSVGMLETIYDRAGRGPGGSARNFNFLESENVGDILDVTMPRQQATSIANRLDAERAYADVAGKTWGNSQTAYILDKPDIPTENLFAKIQQTLQDTWELTDDEAVRLARLIATPGGVADAVDFANQRRMPRQLVDVLAGMLNTPTSQVALPVVGASIAEQEDLLR